MATLEQALQDARSKLANDDGKMLERDMCKEKVIEPVLKALGWGTGSDGGQYKWQHNIWKPYGKKDRADYALIVGENNPSLLIEAKRPGSELQDPKTIKQVETYAKQKQVEVAIITDGNIWRFYLRQNQQELKDCLALEVSLEKESSAEFLRKVLSRYTVANGWKVRH